MKALLKNTAGNATIALIISAFALVGTIAGPVWYLSQYKESVAITDTKQTMDIESIQKEHDEFKQDIKEVRAGVNALLIAQGINPSKVVTSISSKN